MVLRLDIVLGVGSSNPTRSGREFFSYESLPAINSPGLKIVGPNSWKPQNE